MSIITGDAVVLDLRPARVPTRMLATLIDLALFYLWFYAVGRVVNGFDDASAALAQGLSISLWIVGALGYPIAMETLTRGRTVGAYVLGLRAVRDDGGVVRFRHVLIRWLAYWFVDFAIFTGFCGGVVCATLNRDGKRIGDLLAGTMVIRVRSPRGLNPPPDVPAEYAAYAARLDLTNVNDELMAAARNLAQRHDRMRPAPRAQLVNEMARQIAFRVSPPPPYDLPAEDFLTLVVAERRLRARDKLARTSSVPTAEQLPNGWR